ncbi:tetratricopeptide repeat protein [Sediminibacterium sp.]|jgi:tetratricopeptide (TPR) repeat protein|uniref:YfgM family protein n=1 Tax=Sediminibacterium sp. TaxID=1917865 RepID=UPI002600AEA4|nr:tetratricopeptide repeat protein [Sediminibacterium sp.]MBW0177444.1 tetratricopeptide repeat protein [Sediminibacterium sp.]
MSDKHEVTNEQQALAKAQGFWQQYQKIIIGAVAVVVIGFAGWYGYKEYIVKPKEEKAAEALFKAEEYFRMDSANLVLNGDGQSRGALYVIKNFSGTKAANLAHFYAGVSYLKLGDFNNAVKYLKDFSTDAKQIQLLAFGALGDAYAEQNKTDDAISYYKKAGSTFEKDDNNSAEYLFRAALLLETKGKNEEALAIYKDIKEKFPKTDKGFQADRYIYRLSIEKNDLGAN